MNKVARAVRVKPLGDGRVGHSALQVLIDRQGFSARAMQASGSWARCGGSPPSGAKTGKPAFTPAVLAVLAQHMAPRAVLARKMHAETSRLTGDR